jgi:hypothetical protein
VLPEDVFPATISPYNLAGTLVPQMLDGISNSMCVVCVCVGGNDKTQTQ